MRTLSLLVSVAVASLGQPPWSKYKTAECVAPVAGRVNPVPKIIALAENDREKRPWFIHAKVFGREIPVFVGKTVPGKITAWYYDWLMPDGSVVRKVVDGKIPGVKDKRALSDSHPNLDMLQKTSGVAAGPMGAAGVALVGASKGAL